MFIEAARKMNYVHRLAGTRTLRPYTVTEHCAQAAILYADYCDSLGENLDPELMRFILSHDILETYTGDLLAPAKNLCPDAWDKIEEAVVNEVRSRRNIFLASYTDEYIVKNFDSESVLVWRLCDTTELALFCLEEVRAGNKSMDIRSIVCYAHDKVVCLLEGRDNLLYFRKVMEDLYFEELWFCLNNCDKKGTL